MTSTNQGKHRHILDHTIQKQMVQYKPLINQDCNIEFQIIHKSNNHPCSGQFRCPWTQEGVVRVVWTHHKHEMFFNTAAAERERKTGILSTCSHEQFTFWFTTNQTAATMNIHRQTHLLLSCSRKNTQSCSCRLFFRTVSQGLTVASHCPVYIPQLLKPVEGERF